MADIVESKYQSGSIVITTEDGLVRVPALRRIDFMSDSSKAFNFEPLVGIEFFHDTWHHHNDYIAFSDIEIAIQEAIKFVSLEIEIDATALEKSRKVLHQLKTNT